MDKDEQIIWTKRLRIELEHNDLVERRNAFYVLETAVPIGMLTIAVGLQLVTSDNLAPIVLAAGLIFYVIHVFLTEPYDQRLGKLRSELDTMSAELGLQQHKQPEAQPSGLLVPFGFFIGSWLLVIGVIVVGSTRLGFLGAGLFSWVIAVIENWRSSKRSKQASQPAALDKLEKSS